MKRILIFTIGVFLCGVITAQTAPEKTKASKNKAIIIELSMPNMEMHKIEIPINQRQKKSDDISGGAMNSCGGCGNEYARMLASSSYSYKAYAVIKTKSSANVVINIIVGKLCQAEKTLAVYRSKRSKAALGCGASLISYYGYLSKSEK